MRTVFNVTTAVLLGSVLFSTAYSAAPVFRERDPKQTARRLRLIDPPAEGVMRARTTFSSVGVVYGAAKPIEGLALEYRAKGTEAWKTGLALEYFPEAKSYRGSAVYLDEDRDYEVRLAAQGKTIVSDTVRTWKSDVKVAKTIEIDPATFVAPYEITAKGTADGWIRYTVKGGVLKVGDGKPAFVLKDASHVILEDMVIDGCRECSNVIVLEKTKDVRIRHCDISGWGRLGKPDYINKGGKYVWGPKNRTVNYDGAISITRGCENTVIERCWIHDPKTPTNSWRYSHPAGSEAVLAAYAGPGTVIRYNDFVGSDEYRWNDAVEGPGNFFEDGGLNRDADVYGNFMIFCNDDNIELDGGQLNVRCFRNRFESALCGVSVQGCMVGPSYVFDNVFCGGGDEFDDLNNPIKRSGINLYGYDTCTHLFNNDFWHLDKEVTYEDGRMRFVARGNTYTGGIRPNTALPYRPIPYTLDRARIEGLALQNDRVEPVTVTATCGGANYAQPFEIAKNGVFDWFTVTPAKGVMKSGEKTVFTVTFDPAKLRNRHDYRGAFLVRTADGYSRPVSLYVKGQYENPARPQVKDGAVAVYVDTSKLNLRKGSKKPVEFAFDLPKDGKYGILVRVRGGKFHVKGGVDADTLVNCKIASKDYWSWQHFSPNCNNRLPTDSRMAIFGLKAGRHVIRIQNGSSHGHPEIDGLVVTDDIGAFEPR